MSVNYNAARKEMFALFKAAWDANSAAIAMYIPEVRYQGVELATKPPSSKHWARVSTQTIKEEQETLSSDVGEPGTKRYGISGLIFVQLFAPKNVATAFDELTRLGQVARNAFRGKTTPGSIWFRNVRINELPAEDLFYRINVVAEFEYCELG